ncbi:portal protein [Cupriavidus gilardii]|uniref:Portal protein n=1 Tax=Cupriavidus gilardii TaxID=82541 RepID=A0A849BCJ8_9BURK|nr:portal protein [Cupriavidus gilardii]KAB0597785.1 hypothetical protein F7Q96_07645 [Cupriavidus gilardii]NNH12076.1 hypothetical protein [Cupriavidus gilardii]
MAKREKAIVEEAHKRFALCEEAEATNRRLFLEDLRFANGDPDNHYQWPDQILRSRQEDQRPILTVNKVKQHNRQISNEARQNKPSIRVYPVDSGADKKTADIYNGIIRHIEQNSDADTAYDTAAEFAVDAGIGYWRVTTEYVSEESFEQEIYIRRVKNPLNIFLDPNIEEADGSDAKFAFVFQDLPCEEFKAQYPNAKQIGWPKLGGGDAWLNKDTIRIAEYFCIEELTDTLIADENGNTILMSAMSPEDRELIDAMPIQRKRTVKRRKVNWYFIAGDKVLEQRDWLGKYIPIVRVVGDEVDIDGKTDRKGNTRALKDAQRMYNYWTSCATEFVALQGKSPYVGPARAFEGYEKYWNNANMVNFPYLPYNDVDAEGQPVTPPQRQMPPTMAQGYVDGMRIAAEELKMASGQYDASMGARSNETSGKAIMARQREGDTATFHFVDNVARAIKYTGRILIDLIPKIYDTPRIVRILGEDGSEDHAKIDPQQQRAFVEKRDAMTGEIERIYNPAVGRYDVAVSVGPSYTTRRQEAFDALTQMVQGNPQLLATAGDLIMKAADFPMADELAERLEKMVPQELKGEDESPAIAQMRKQLQQMQGQLATLGQEYNKLAEGKDLDRQKLLIDRYKAETERLKLIYPTMPVPIANEIAADMGLQAMASPDIYPGGPPGQEEMQQEPASAGFFMPTDSAGLQAPDQQPM